MEKAKKIFVIDDEPDIVAITAFRLKKWGYDVMSAGDGLKALRKLKSEKPDLILLDFGLPGIHGSVLCRLLKAATETSDIPVVIISASREGMDEKSRDCGADDYLVKPYDMDELQEKIKNALSGKYAKNSKDALNGHTGVDIDDLLADYADVDDLKADYVKHRKSDLIEMDKNLKEGNIKNIKLLGHRMSGSGQLYGFDSISEIGGAIEIAAKNNELPAVRRLWEKLKCLLETK